MQPCDPGLAHKDEVSQCLIRASTIQFGFTNQLFCAQRILCQVLCPSFNMIACFLLWVHGQREMNLWLHSLFFSHSVNCFFIRVKRLKKVKSSFFSAWVLLSVFGNHNQKFSANINVPKSLSSLHLVFPLQLVLTFLFLHIITDGIRIHPHACGCCTFQTINYWRNFPFSNLSFWGLC